jgi:hypothetical protein
LERSEFFGALFFCNFARKLIDNENSSRSKKHIKVDAEIENFFMKNVIENF